MKQPAIDPEFAARFRQVLERTAVAFRGLVDEFERAAPTPEVAAVRAWWKRQGIDPNRPIAQPPR